MSLTHSQINSTSLRQLGLICVNHGASPFGSPQTDRHQISIDWLLFGNLKGLLSTVQNHKKERPKPLTAEQFADLYSQLNPLHQEFVMEQLLEMAGRYS
jgi:hypothetical protein